MLYPPLINKNYSEYDSGDGITKMAVINGLYLQRKAEITVFTLAKACDKSAICAV